MSNEICNNCPFKAYFNDTARKTGIHEELEARATHLNRFSQMEIVTMGDVDIVTAARERIEALGSLQYCNALSIDECELAKKAIEIAIKK